MISNYFYVLPLNNRERKNNNTNSSHIESAFDH